MFRGQTSHTDRCSCSSGLASIGEREAAIQGWNTWAETFGIRGEDLARQVLDTFTAQLARAVDDFYRELENMPLYTVHEVLNPPELRPRYIVGLGAPAGVYLPPLAAHLTCPAKCCPSVRGPMHWCAAHALLWGYTRQIPNWAGLRFLRWGIKKNYIDHSLVSVKPVNSEATPGVC